MAIGHSPMIRRKRLGSELRRLREHAGYTGDQLAARLGWSASKVSRIENARVRPEVGDVMDLLDELGVLGAKREELIAVARDAASTRGWWRSYGDDMSQRQRGYAELEAGTESIREFRHVLIPGLLQTADYARVRFEAARSLGRADFNIAAAVKARQERHQVLLRSTEPVRYEAVLGEAALRLWAAPLETVQGQLRHLAEVTSLPNVTLRVLPFDAPTDDNVTGANAFSLYRFADAADPEIVAVETVTADLHFGDEDDVLCYNLLFERLRAAALPPGQSAAFISHLADQLS